MYTIYRALPFFALTLPLFAFSQANVRDSSISSPMITAAYKLQFPGNDMAERFGINSAIGGGFLYKHTKRFLIGADSYFLFGGNVREDYILDGISTGPDADGNRYIIDGNGTFAEVFLYERGFTITLKAGYLWPLFGPNPNSGLLMMGSMGFMQHKIRIENTDNTAHQLTGDLKKGYDRLSNGMAWGQFIGYMHLGNNHLVNFYAGLDITEGFTRSRRSLDYDTGKKDLTKRLDVLYGIKAGWIFPLYRRAPEKRYYY